MPLSSSPSSSISPRRLSTTRPSTNTLAAGNHHHSNNNNKNNNNNHKNNKSTTGNDNDNRNRSNNNNRSGDIDGFWKSILEKPSSPILATTTPARKRMTTTSLGRQNPHDTHHPSTPAVAEVDYSSSNSLNYSQEQHVIDPGLAAGPTDEHDSNPSFYASNDLNDSYHTSVVGLSPMELEDLRRSFALLDVDRTGRISVHTFLSVLERLRITTQQQQHPRRRIHPAFARLDQWKRERQQQHQQDDDNDNGNDNDESIDFDTYCHFLTDPDPNDHRTELQKVFDLFDVQNQGFITIQDLARVAHELGEDDMSATELQEMMIRATTVFTGGASSANAAHPPPSDKVTLEQFEALMNKSIVEE